MPRRSARQIAASKENLRRARIAGKSKMSFTQRTALEATRPSSEFAGIRAHHNKVQTRLRNALRGKPIGKKQRLAQKASKAKALPMPPRSDW